MPAPSLSSRAGLALLVSALLVGCGPVEGGDPQPDASMDLPDAGSNPDAGADPDAGTPPDAGPGPDAGGGASELPDGCEEPFEAEGFPSVATTGVPAGLTLAPNGALRVTQNGAVIEAQAFTGTVTVEANDVTLRRSRITGSGTAIVLARGATRLTIEDVTVAGEGVEHASPAIRVLGGEVTVRRLQVHGFAEAVFIDGGSGLIEDSLFLCLPDIEGGDTIEAWGAHDLVIRHNRFDRRGGNSNIKFPTDVTAPGRDARIEGNLLAGGGWSVYGGHDPGKPQATWTNVAIVDNRFSVRHHERSGYWGPIAFSKGDLTTGNVWHESGAPLSAPPPRQE